MKRCIFFILLLAASVSLWAQSFRRNIEFGFDMHAGFANSYLSPAQIFQETITVDLTTMAQEMGSGFSIFTGGVGDVFFNVNGVNFGFGWFAGMDAAGQFNIPQSLVELMTQGNSADSYSGTFNIGGAAFAETGFWTSVKILQNINIIVRPSYFLPLAYLVRNDAGYSLTTYSEKGEDGHAAGDIYAEVGLNATLYTPFPTEEGSEINVGEMIGRGGGDVTLGAEYSLFPNLILGAFLTHLPLAPAQLQDGYNIKTKVTYNQNTQELLGGKDSSAAGEEGEEVSESEGLDSEDLTFDSFTGSERVIFRPVKLGVNALYRPFNERFIALKPYAALVFNGIYNTPVYLDFGGTAELNLMDIFVVGLGTHYEDLVWRHSLGLAFNARAVELDFGISIQSQDFLKSFQAAGIRVDLGFRMGW